MGEREWEHLVLVLSEEDALRNQLDSVWQTRGLEAPEEWALTIIKGRGTFREGNLFKKEVCLIISSQSKSLGTWGD